MTEARHDGRRPVTSSRAAALWGWLLAPRDAAGVAFFRVAFGLLVAASAWRFLASSWVDDLFTGTKLQLKYWGWQWVPALPAPWIDRLFVALGVLGVLVAVGLFYRAAIVLLFVTFTYLQVHDVSNYLNHYYLVVLLAGLLCFVPAHRAFSLDACIRPGLRSDMLPAWCTYLLRFQVAVVYVFAGIAKLTTDWLLHAQPLNIWLAARTDLPIVGPWLGERWVAYLASWGGVVFDTSVVCFLLARRTRPIAYLAVIAFHAATLALFPIGMFPFIMTVSALIFFDSSWPREAWRRIRRRAGTPTQGRGRRILPPLARPGRAAWLALGAAAVYVALQIAIPLRTHAYGGNVQWHEQGMRFSWRVMTREKNGSVTFVVRDPSDGREWHVPPRQYLTRIQEREMSVQPDLILQLAHHIARDFRAKGRNVEVRADALASLNGRPAVRLVNPEVDLARVADGLAPKWWIGDPPAGPPPHLRPLLIAERRP